MMDICCSKLELNNDELNNKIIIDSIAKTVVKLAKDSINETLDINVVTKGVSLVISNHSMSYYNIMKRGDITVGSNKVQYQYDLITNSYYHWIGSLYVSEQERRQGLFSKYLLPFNASQVLGSQLKMNKVIRLYMDTINKTAQKAYTSNDFKVLDFTIYIEDDLKIKSNSIDYKYLQNHKISISNEKDLELLKSYLITNDLSCHYEGLSNVLSNKSLGLVLTIINKNDDKIEGLCYVFYEPSDWLNNLMWWVYFMHFDSKLINAQQLINSICDYNSTNGGCGVGFMLKNLKEEDFQGTRALKTNKLIYEKEV